MPAAETVRVQSLDGVPRIVVDGRPVRARMFWGAPRGGRLRVEPGGREFVFEFTAGTDAAGHGTMHFRFGHEPGAVVIDEIQVSEVAGGGHAGTTLLRCNFDGGQRQFDRLWHVWPPGEPNTVGAVEVASDVGREGSAGLKITLNEPPDGRWPDFHLYSEPNLPIKAGRRYRVRLWAKAGPARWLTVAFYRPGQPFVFLGGPPGSFQSQIKLAAAVGVDFVSFPIPMPWPRPGQPVDWSGVDRTCRQVLEANPQALLLPRIPMDPPGWWVKEHPDDCMVWDRGRPTRRPAVVASPRYRRDAAERLRALIRHLEKEFGPHIAGYHPCGQNTGEWFYQDTWRAPLNGYSTASRAAWRRWLKERYGSDAALQAAWRDSTATCETAEVPSPESRLAAPSGLLRDPATERPLIDFAEFQQQMMAECVCHFARVVREASGGRKLVVFFYGYVFEFGAIRNGAAVSGHYALRRVLESPDIDILCSPISYFDRGLGGSAPAMTAAESVALAGKMWLYEDDTRTHIASGQRFPGWRDAAKTPTETINMLLRNTGQCAVRNFGTWWMDLGASGWFDDPALWKQMERLKPLDEALLRQPQAFRPEVAAVIDERSMIRVAAGGDAITRPLVYEVRRPLGRMGAPYGQYLLDDVAASRVRAKMYVFLTAWCLSPEQRRQLLDATAGSLSVWCYASGYQDPDRVSIEAMRELTGFRLQPTEQPQAWAEPTDVGRRLGLTAGFGVKRPIRPLFFAADARPDEVLATYPDGKPAVALRRTDGGWSLFVGPPALTSELLRLAARRADVHLFTDTDCNVYANGPFLVLHASHDGPIQLNTGRSGPVRDVFTGKTLGDGPKLKLTLKKGETRILQY
ncbi:MAG: hypothetical protein GXP27_06075 [Planctomycetes bacterium]|nr:hypothetical protein [Planctomycetota bacterium]